jgi:hypothetical protein
VTTHPWDIHDARRQLEGALAGHEPRAASPTVAVPVQAPSAATTIARHAADVPAAPSSSSTRSPTARDMTRVDASLELGVATGSLATADGASWRISCAS